MSQPPPALPASASVASSLPSSLASSLAPSAALAPGPAVRDRAGQEAPGYVSALGTLRGVLTLLVVLHHALLAYHPYAPPVRPSLSAMPFWRAFPVVDAQRWSGATWLVAWNDTFFMALMFLLSGLFVWPSLARKGVAAYARDRLLRIGLPFAVFALALSPLAYLPSYLQTGAAWSWSGFWSAWTALDSWPTGPAWFLSVLLAFDAVAIALFGLLRRPRLAGPRRALAFIAERPWPFALALAALAVAAYVPLAQRYGTMRWTELGPFTFQTSRIGLYAAFFLVGLAAGASGLARSALVAARGLARWWWLWLPLAALAFRASIKTAIVAMNAMGQSVEANRDAALAYAAACAAISLAMLAVAVALGRRFDPSLGELAADRSGSDADSAAGSGSNGISGSRAAPPAPARRGSLLRSLQRNAYGIYLFHYAAVSWLQYAALRSSLPGLAKACLVFSSAVAIAWILTATLRRLRPLARVL